MGEFEKTERQEIFSRAVRAGKRTYFFDVKSTRAGDYYLTITESKKRFNNELGKFYYEKHKIFLYKEDFEKFKNGFEDVVDFIINEAVHEDNSEKETKDVEKFSEVNFEDLDSEAKPEKE